MDLYTRVANDAEFPYIVSIQNKHIQSQSQSVGVLIQAQLVLATCNIFKEKVESVIYDEEDRFNEFRVLASDVYLITRVEAPYPITPQVRFIENVYLHPQCKEVIVTPLPNVTRTWRYDLAVVRLSFAFHLDSLVPKLDIVRFINTRLERRTERLVERRLREFEEFEATGSGNCTVVGWGRTVYIGDPAYHTNHYRPSFRLLVSEVRLMNHSYCQKFCGDNPMLCGLNDTTNGHLVCAQRTQGVFVYQFTNFSHFPGPGTEGSPLICRGPDGESDIYGILNYLPDSSCKNKLPLVFSRIDDVSHFVRYIIGKAVNQRGSLMQLILSITTCILINYVW